MDDTVDELTRWVEDMHDSDRARQRRFHVARAGLRRTTWMCEPTSTAGARCISDHRQVAAAARHVAEKMLQLQRKNPTAVKLLRRMSARRQSVLYRMMARRPQSRYESPAEVAQALRACRCWAPNVAPPRLPPSREETLYDPTAPVKPASKPLPRTAPATASQLELPAIETPSAPLPRRRNPWLVAGACLVAAALLGLLAYLAFMFNAGRTGAHGSDVETGIRHVQAPKDGPTSRACKMPDHSR